MLYGISLFVLLTSSIQAFPDGAGGCDAGPAVRGLHLDDSNGRIVSAGNFQSAKVEFRINGAVMNSETPVDLAIGQNHIVEVEALEFPIRGALFRLEAPDGIDTAGALTPEDLMKNAVICEAPVVGTTHFNRDVKTKMTSTVRFDEAVEKVVFDVTAVFVNSAEGSVFVFDRFAANFVGASKGPTPKMDTSAPMTMPINNGDIPTSYPMTESPVSGSTTLTAKPSNAPMRMENMTTSVPLDGKTDSPIIGPSPSPPIEPREPTSFPKILNETTSSPSTTQTASPMVAETTRPIDSRRTPVPTSSTDLPVGDPTQKKGAKNTGSEEMPPPAILPTSAPSNKGVEDSASAPNAVSHGSKGGRGSTESGRIKVNVRERKKKNKSSSKRGNKLHT